IFGRRFCDLLSGSRDRRLAEQASALADRRDPSTTGPDVELLQSVDSKRLRDLAAVITIVRDHTHQHRLARMDLDLPITLTAEVLLLGLHVVSVLFLGPPAVAAGSVRYRWRVGPIQVATRATGADASGSTLTT